MYAILCYTDGRTRLVECARFFAPNFLPKGVHTVHYYHGKKAGAIRKTLALADANVGVTKVAPLRSGDRIRNSWSIMEDQGYILG